MGRLDDIVARNQQASKSDGSLLGAILDSTSDPLDTPEDRRRKLIAWTIVGGVVVVVVALIAAFA